MDSIKQCLLHLTDKTTLWYTYILCTASGVNPNLFLGGEGEILCLTGRGTK